MEEGAILRSRDIEPNPKLDSAQFFYQNPKLDYALSNCGQLLTGSKLSPSDMSQNAKLRSDDSPQVEKIEFW